MEATHRHIVYGGRGAPSRMGSHSPRLAFLLLLPNLQPANIWCYLVTRWLHCTCSNREGLMIHLDLNQHVFWTAFSFLLKASTSTPLWELKECLIHRYGISYNITSDQKSHFTAKEWAHGRRIFWAYHIHRYPLVNRDDRVKEKPFKGAAEALF